MIPFATPNVQPFVSSDEHFCHGISAMVFADCFDFLRRLPENSLHGVVTDPPYGVKEYDPLELQKLEVGKGGVWRIPPAFDGSTRAALPRFTDLNHKELQRVSDFFEDWSRLLVRALRPGGHVFVASNAFLSLRVNSAIASGGLEFRGEVIRLVRTFRGGDRPKNFEVEFSDVCTLPRGSYEPWGLFRKPLPKGMTVGECLREFQTGGLRRISGNSPFSDVIESERTSSGEKRIANHPSLKPQSFLRKIVRAALPLGQGILIDPFSGSGSTVAAADACGLSCIGVERMSEFYTLSKSAIPALSRVMTS